MSKGYYICQRAAQAIIVEIGPFRVSSDALQAINSFIDEFIYILFTSASSLDPISIKATINQLLPQSLGKNAIVEAELELKNQSLDQVTIIKQTIDKIDNKLLEKIIPVIQQSCSLYCTLSDEDEEHVQDYDPFNDVIQVDNVIVSPIIIIYVTTIIEHITEYILNSIAVTADQSDAEHIRLKEVLLTLIDDPQVSNLFKRMNLKEKLEKRVSNTYSNIYSTTIPTPVPSPISIKKDLTIQRHSHSILNSKDDPDFNDDPQSPRATPSSTYSMLSNESTNERPNSIMSNGTIKSSGSKNRFNFFSLTKANQNQNSPKKLKRLSLNFSTKRASSPPVTSPTTPSCISSSIDFEELIKSGNTKKVTLTPNRLRSIEVKEDNNPILPKITRTTSLSHKKRASELYSHHQHPIPPMPHLMNRENMLHTSTSVMVLSHHHDTSSSNNSPPLTPVSSVASRPSQRSSRQSIIYEENQKTSNNRNETTKLSEDTPKKKSNTPRVVIVEKPSSMVVKRTTMGSRPPSFHEGTMVLSSVEQSHSDMIYVIPSSINSVTRSSISLNQLSKIRTTIDRSCQTDNQDDDEEWFLDENDLKDSIIEEERIMTEWLLGTA